MLHLIGGSRHRSRGPLGIQGDSSTVLVGQVHHRRLVCVNNGPGGRRCPSGKGVTGASEAVCCQILCDTVDVRGILHCAGTAVGIVLDGIRIAAVIQLQYSAAICCNGGGCYTVRVRGVLGEAGVGLCNGRHS